MLILGFDTATRATTVALLDTADGAVLERRDDPPLGIRPSHTTLLMPLVAEVMAARSCRWEDIDRIAVGVGPGTFTGLRIGVATARALAGAREIELVGVSTLASVARAAAGATAEHEGVVAVLDARRREVFAAAWPGSPAPGDGGPAPLLEPRAIAPDALSQLLAAGGGAWLAVGGGAVEFRQVLDRSGVRIPEDDSPVHRVSAAEHCRLAQGLRPESPGEVHPHYLRLPDAELARRAPRLP